MALSRKKAVNRAKVAASGRNPRMFAGSTLTTLGTLKSARQPEVTTLLCGLP